jgi:hypothetical protein
MEHVIRLLYEAEERAVRAEKTAEIICSKAIEAVRAAQLRAEQTEARAREVAQHAAWHIKLLYKRVAEAEGLPRDLTKVDPFERAPANANQGYTFTRLQ